MWSHELVTSAVQHGLVYNPTGYVVHVEDDGMPIFLLSLNILCSVHTRLSVCYILCVA